MRKLILGLLAVAAIGCGEVDEPPISMPALVLSVQPACDITDGGKLDSLDGLTFVSAHQASDTQAITESLNGWVYVYRGTATGMFHGGVAAYPRVACEQTFNLVPTIADCAAQPCP